MDKVKVIWNGKAAECLRWSVYEYFLFVDFGGGEEKYELESINTSQGCTFITTKDGFLLEIGAKNIKEKPINKYRIQVSQTTIQTFEVEGTDRYEAFVKVSNGSAAPVSEEKTPVAFGEPVLIEEEDLEIKNF